MIDTQPNSYFISQITAQAPDALEYDSNNTFEYCCYHTQGKRYIFVITQKLLVTYKHYDRFSAVLGS